MTPDEYDKYLASFKDIEDWYNVPIEDWSLFNNFGSVAPRILKRPHVLFVPSGSTFRAFVDVVGGPSCAVVGESPPSSLNREPNFGRFDSLEQEFSEWGWDENQRWLISEIYQVSSWKSEYWSTVICNANLPPRALSRLSRTKLVLQRGMNLEPLEVFDEIESLLDECRWFYIALSETSRYDMAVFADDAMARAFRERIPDLARQATWAEGRAHWPEEPPPATE